MRSRFISYAVLAALIATFGLTGCKNPPWKKKTGGTTGQGEVPPIGTGPGGIPTGERPPIGPGSELLHGQFAPVYFDFDSATIRPGEASKLEAVAAWMRSNAAGRLVIEGHCDERGTAEYNRSLGERRAGAAREKLVSLGVDAGRVTTVSYGKDKPADPGHDDAAWAKNRRCEFATVRE